MATTQPLVWAQTSPAPPARAGSSATVQLKAADEAFRAGSAAYLQNDLHTAHVQFARVVQLAPNVAAGHSAFGTVLLAEGDAQAAVAQLDRAHRLDPRDAGVILNLALAYSQLRDYAGSVKMFRLLDQAKAEALTPQAAVAYAAALNATGQPAEARKQLEATIATSPNSAVLHDALGTLLAQQKHYDEAATQFQRAISLDASLAAAHYHLGSVYLNQNQPAAAVTELTQANDLEKENIAYALQLGRAFRANNQDEAALAVLNSALTLDAVSVDAKYELALTLQASERAHEALPLFEEVTTARPRDFEALTNFGLALVQTGDAKSAIPIYNRALALNAKSATLHEDLGVAYLQQSDLNHAIEQFRAGLAVEPNNSQLHYDLGLAFKLKDDTSAAVPEFKHAEDLDPQLPDPPYTLGVLYMQLGRFAEAQGELERATVLRPDNGEAWAILGNVYKETSQFQKATDALRRAMELMPNQPSPHISLAAILSQQGDHAGALAERKKAADLSRIAVSRQRANFALDSGRALLKKGQVAEAVAQLQSAVEADPNYSDAHSALADALERQGQSAAAALERQRAQKLLEVSHSPASVAPSQP
jgi:protein O-GlcNAc transferase